MSVSIAISSGAAASSAVAASQARRAREIACEGLVNGYDAEAATIHDMQQYSECVHLLYPQELSGGSVLLLKLLFVLSLIGAVYGGYLSTRIRGWEWFEIVMGGLCGFAVTGGGLVLIGLLIGGIGWLFS